MQIPRITWDDPVKGAPCRDLERIIVYDQETIARVEFESFMFYSYSRLPIVPQKGQVLFRPLLSGPVHG
jgi:hypothetical protein